MSLLTIYGAIAAARAEQLVVLLVVGLVVGEWAARLLQVESLFARGRGVVMALDRKLNRAKRGAATVIYRGIIALIMLLVPAVVMGALLAQKTPTSGVLSAAMLVVLFGYAAQPYRALQLLRQARTGKLALETPGGDFLFADTHAVLRHAIAQRVDAFAVGLVGGAFWYMVGDVPVMFAYLTLACAARHYRTRFFGWSARNLFYFFDFIPQIIARTLLLLAMVFTPQTRLANPLRGTWRDFTARVLDIALGGPEPEGLADWAGQGTAQVTPIHLRRAWHLLFVGCLLLALVLAIPHIHKTLIIII